MKKEQNRHSLHLIRQNVPQFILLVIFSVLLGVSVIAVSILMKMFLDIAFLPHGAFSAQRHGGAPIPHRP